MQNAITAKLKQSHPRSEFYQRHFFASMKIDIKTQLITQKSNYNAQNETARGLFGTWLGQLTSFADEFYCW